MIKDAVDLVDGRTIPEHKEELETPFDKFIAATTFKKGQARFRNLILRSPKISVHGYGKCNLGEDTINMNLNTRALASFRREQKRYRRLKNVTLYIQATGRPSAPSYYLDVKNLLYKIGH